MIKQLFILGTILIAGCSQKPTNNQTVTKEESPKTENSSDEYPNYKSLDFARVEEVKDTSMFYLVDKICAISVLPDTSWLNTQQKSMSEDAWNTIIDDHTYYESLATDTLKLKGIETYYKDDKKRFIVFKKSDNTFYTIDRSKMKDIWSLILFNGNDNPVIWSGLFIGGAYKEIYKK